MQRWSEELAKHPIVSVIQLFKDVSALDFENINSSLELERGRFSKFTKSLDTAYKKLDPDLAPIDTLTQLHNILQSHNAPSTATSIIRTMDANLFRDLNTQINPALSYLLQIQSGNNNRIAKDIDQSVATESFERYSKQVDARLTELEAKATSLESQILTSLADAQTSLSDTKLSNQQFKNKVIEWTTQQGELVVQFKTEFTNMLTEMKREHSSSIKEVSERFKSEAQDFFKLHQAWVEDQQIILQETSTKILDDAEEKHKQILEFYKLTATDSVAGGHLQVAQREYDSAFYWRIATICAVGGAAAWILASFFLFKPTLYPVQLFWLEIAKSVSLTAILISFAVYASKQSSLHRNNERKARAFFLQVKAFDPFVASLSIEKQAELKEALSQRIFGTNDFHSDPQNSSDANFEGIEKIVEVFNRIKSSVSK